MARKKASQARKGNKKKAQHHAHAEGSGGGCAGEGEDAPCSNKQGSNGQSQGHGSSSSSQSTGGGGGSGSGTKGPVPNLFWGHVSDAQLRRMDRFVGLPPTRSILPMWSTDASRFLRQGSEQWRALHAGVLTTGNLKEALGLREAAAARIVGGKAESSHTPLLDAWRHLRQGVAATGAQPGAQAGAQAHTSTPPGPASAGDGRTLGLAEAGEDQEQRALGRLARLLAAGAGAGASAGAGAAAAGTSGGEGDGAATPRGGAALAEVAPATVRPRAGSQPGEASAGGGRAAGAGGGEGHGLPESEEQQQQQPQQAAKAEVQDRVDQEEEEEEEEEMSHADRYARSAAAWSSGGLVGVRCGWGKVQEAAALAQLLHAFPASLLHEVGMCPVSPERLPPATPPLHPPTSTSGTPAPPPKQPQPAAATASTAGSGPAAGAAASSLPTMTPPPSLPLPPLAASPDAVITHHLPLGPREAEELARQVRVAEAAVRAAREAAAGAPEQPAAAGQGSAASADKGRNQAAGGRKQQGPQQGRQQARGGWDDRHALLLRLTVRELLERVPLTSRGRGDSSSNGSSSSGTDSGRETPNGQVEDDEGEPEGEGEEEELGLGNCSGSVDGGIVGAQDGGQEDGSGEAAADAAAGRTGDGGAEAVEDTSSVSRAVCEQLAACAARLHGGALLAAALDAPSPVLLLCGACSGRWRREEGSGSLRDGRVQQQSGGGSGEAAAGSGGARGVGQGQAAGTNDAVGEEEAAGAGACALLPWCTCRAATCRVGSGSDGCGGAAQAGAAGSSRGSRDAAGGAPPPPGPGSSAAPCVHAVLREVVEVKNTCPFGLKQVRRGGKGRLQWEVVVSDRGPRHSLPPYWIPQLQLHMAACGCHSGLLVSRSATKGCHVFRVMRDDAYLARMLGIIGRLQREYVVPGVQPPPDMFARSPEYVSFLGHTVRIARTAVLLPCDPRAGVVQQAGEGLQGVVGPNRDDAFIGPADA